MRGGAPCEIFDAVDTPFGILIGKGTSPLRRLGRTLRPAPCGLSMSKGGLFILGRRRLVALLPTGLAKRPRGNRDCCNSMCACLDKRPRGTSSRGGICGIKSMQVGRSPQGTMLGKRIAGFGANRPVVNVGLVLGSP